MKQRVSQGRMVWLGAALLATLLAAQWVSGDDGSADLELVSPPVEGKIREKEARQKEVHPGGNEVEDKAANRVEIETGELNLERLERRKFSSQAGAIFGSQSWVPPPPPPALEKPRPPSPPPLQFKYLGKVIEGEETRVFLALADRNYIVKPGERINNQYRIDGVNDQAVTFTYLPLNAKQVLATAGTGSIQ
ncbi:MAG TPA: secretion system X translation initiation factor [Nitrosospira sp.]|nr:secretion system X translation initiation factor [Nitrosospira sp.]